MAAASALNTETGNSRYRREPSSWPIVWASSTGSAATLKAPPTRCRTTCQYASAMSEAATAWNRMPAGNGSTGSRPTASSHVSRRAGTRSPMK
ncbi:hypothetical protein ACFFX0_10255 [Citricoccus parietis]|uniref:Uncharacterized protein n=1 Tax=Citricoccus parietis TaxID=592307 RepID=A0ABV5FZ94_9MICC